MFSIKDAKAQIFHKPYFATTHGEAERNFRTTVNSPDNNLNQYPEDFDLWYLGEYNDQTGQFDPVETPQHVIKAIQCMKPQGILPPEDC